MNHKVYLFYADNALVVTVLKIKVWDSCVRGGAGAFKLYYLCGFQSIFYIISYNLMQF
jgi:hypothetical protein